ncbi:type IV secretion system protein [Pseudomonas syringae pv. coryli]|uniref:type IV secretion system protein n=1 Tax=Pseudomonas syringae pv. coryli TaxID=317659 RepID=UPI003D292992
MQRKARVMVAALAIVAAFAPVHSQATGIPTLDFAAIAQAVTDAMQQAQEAASQLSAIEREIDQAKSQFDQIKKMNVGNSGYGGMYNNPDMVEYLPTSTTSGSWEQIYTNMDQGQLSAYRTKYDMQSDDPLQQEVFDKQLTNLSTAQGAYRANNLRLQNLKDLQQLADSAQTPQEKQDIQARLQVEQASITNESNRLATSKDIMERQDKLLAAKQNKKFEDFLNGE